MADIFISYRRDDARADAGRLHDRLSQRFGHQRVFMDVDDVEPGVDFVELLHATLETCGVVVVVIGNDWLGQNPDTGETRLANPEDFVHVEVRTALERGIPVVPVLVGGASMPAREQMPEPLLPLLKRQAVELRHTRFSDDADRLIEALSGAIDGRRRKIPRRVVLLALTAATAGAVGFGLWRFAADRATVQLRSEPVMLSVAAAKAMLARLNFYHARWNPAGVPAGGPFEQIVVGDHVIVADRATGLMWQQGSVGRAQVRTNTRRIVRQLNASSFAGFDDWRLPTLEEAMSLMARDATGAYHMAPAFDAGAAPFIWTADRSGDASGWVVYFADGICAPENDRFNASIRAVRSGRLRR